ncbi:MAG: hypothetical protein GY696_12485 [Gammaproteobacteria bacterium]|nr:hypothetical protein [Gammaproteobacteria bacterium]
MQYCTPDFCKNRGVCLQTEMGAQCQCSHNFYGGEFCQNSKFRGPAIRAWEEFYLGLRVP